MSKQGRMATSVFLGFCAGYLAATFLPVPRPVVDPVTLRVALAGDAGAAQMGYYGLLLWGFLGASLGAALGHARRGAWRLVKAPVALTALALSCGPASMGDNGAGGVDAAAHGNGSGGAPSGGGGSPGGSAGSAGSAGAAGASGAGHAGSGGQLGCDASTGCFTVYAHGDHTLYRIDLPQHQLVQIGPFRAPMVRGSNGRMEEDVITDLAVRPDDTIYVISKTSLYTADRNDGHVTLVGALTACGQEAVAMTFGADGTLYTGDFMGAFCKVDLGRQPPAVSVVGMLGGGLALSGDMVAVADGTIFGTAYRLSDASNAGTQANNLLVRIDPATGRASTPIGMTGFPKLFGVAFDQGKVFGFTHDGTGRVVTIDPRTGQGTVFGTFNDPATGMGISFAGAGVNSMVPLIGIHTR